MNTKILLIVDPQYDFLEGGKLAVNGAKNAMEKLVSFILEHYKEYEHIFFTADWHLPSHCSFKDNGGIWSPHCIQFTHGASLYQPLVDVLTTLKVDYCVLTKGCDEDHEEYSIFKNEKSCNYLTRINDYVNVETVDFVGIAYDYCVKDSAIDSKKIFTNSDIRVLKDFCPSIGDPNETTKILENNNITVV